MDGSIFVTNAATGEGRRLTPRRTGEDAPESLACVFSPDGRRIAYTRRLDGRAQIFTVNVPSS
jgi:Tol biopolymer transport system component